ncbi:MAG: hypothetical protein Q8Q17_01775 [bacterium]|nr:hypothetical protein [bacterium]
MDVTWECGGQAVIAFEEEELENAIKAIESVLILYNGSDMSQVLPILVMMRAEVENKRRAARKQGRVLTMHH